MPDKEKIQVIHFHNGGGGGTFIVVKNLLKFSTNPAIENHVIYTINKKLTPHFEIPFIEGAASQQIFYYSPKWNFYYTCRQLAKLLPDERAVLVAHDWLELGMVSNLGLQNPVVQLVHGNYDYYYELAKKHERSIDRFITVSPVIYTNLCLQIPQRISDIHYCRFPVPEVVPVNKENEFLKIFYCVRRLDDENKQFQLLPQINSVLKIKGINVHWTIVGLGMELKTVEKLMGQDIGVALFSSLNNEEVLNLLPAHDLFILPSLKEGFPASVVEAMKAGVVPLVSNWEGATDELITDGRTGYYFETADVEGYATTIAILNKDRSLLKRVAVDGIKKANDLFDPCLNTKNIENVICEASTSCLFNKRPIRVYGSRLDKWWLPNIITNELRRVNY